MSFSWLFITSNITFASHCICTLVHRCLKCLKNLNAHLILSFILMNSGKHGEGLLDLIGSLTDEIFLFSHSMLILFSLFHHVYICYNMNIDDHFFFFFFFFFPIWMVYKFSLTHAMNKCLLYHIMFICLFMCVIINEWRSHL